MKYSNIIDEIELKKNRLSASCNDLEKYNKFCSENNFLTQSKSSHYIYKKLDISTLKSYESYMIAIYTILQNQLPHANLHSIETQNIASKIKTSVNQAIIGDALGFLVENEETIGQMKEHFPEGVVNVRAIREALKSRVLKTKFGRYNNNNLDKEDRILYSDDTEMSMISLQSALKVFGNSNQNPELFVQNLAENIAWHWHYNMKSSGNYGEDGLYYGTRGYGKKSLQAFSDIYNHKLVEQSNLNNGPLISSWVLGLIPYENYMVAAEMAAKKSFITNKCHAVSISCAALASAFYISVYDSPKTKVEVVDRMIEVALLFEERYLNENHNIEFLPSSYLKYAKLAALEDINPVIFYNSAVGYYAHETTAAVVFCFLRHKYFLTSLVESCHIPGDSDSVANLASALMGAYFGQEFFPQDYLQYIETPLITIHDQTLMMDYLVTELISSNPLIEVQQIDTVIKSVDTIEYNIIKKEIKNNFHECLYNKYLNINFAASIATETLELVPYFRLITNELKFNSSMPHILDNDYLLTTLHFTSTMIAYSSNPLIAIKISGLYASNLFLNRNLENNIDQNCLTLVASKSFYAGIAFYAKSILNPAISPSLIALGEINDPLISGLRCLEKQSYYYNNWVKNTIPPILWIANLGMNAMMLYQTSNYISKENLIYSDISIIKLFSYSIKSAVGIYFTTKSALIAAEEIKEQFNFIEDCLQNHDLITCIIGDNPTTDHV
ncbi:ADP-ribosylglycohydrolase [Candidatus Arcanobacter lacustris]|uniref:ADP-ribosylglycohydrolase n=1 Tax=Candidatus Arcanibacter lacustris TaxID=1607817 RepID=A0A0F5MMP1_9RICK|nr:ADP-ribosylglycohydrolase [Candidatus Arcanobacter lacustris]KKB96493.1 ADP-ribosylglycohydrolase [Candidatus Arcanobacter lacustris]